VILKFNQSHSDAIAFLMPNKASKSDLTDYVITIDALEEDLGIDFFHNLDDSIQTIIEKKSDHTRWLWR
jgi:endonuclease G